jgi:hypothetical protein
MTKRISIQKRKKSFRPTTLHTKSLGESMEKQGRCERKRKKENEGNKEVKNGNRRKTGENKGKRGTVPNSKGTKILSACEGGNNILLSGIGGEQNIDPWTKHYGQQVCR